jgi:uncharacterized protein (DUF1015 family)
MVDIRPFKATILNPELPIDKLVCPVYDTIDEKTHKTYALEKNNIIHVTTRRKDMDRDEYIEYAKNSLSALKESKTVVEREKPAFYIYGIMFTLPQELLAQLPESNRRSKYFAFGLVSLVKVEEPGEGNIVGHENIFEINTKERYDVMKACMMNFSPISAEYSMPGHDLNNLFEEYLGFVRPDFVPNPKRPPLVDVTLNRNRHMLWEITDESLINRITGMMAGKNILILDGHHRYTASNTMRKKDGIEYTMMMLMEGGDRALLLLPWHRAVRNFSRAGLDNKINEHFLVLWQGDTIGEEFYSVLRERESEYDVRLGMYDGEKYTILKADENAVRELSAVRGETVGLDLMALHEWLINPVIKGKPVEDVYFNASPSEAVSRVDKGEYDVAFLLNPFSVGDVEKKAFEEGKNFPQKSTLFLPKVAEGIVMRTIG